MNGQVLSARYEVQQLLAKKAGRRTLLARDLVSSELVVIKLLSFSSDFEWDDLKLFEREAETLKSLSHRSIPGYLDYFEVNSPSLKGFALVQTYIPALTLAQHLKAGRTFTEAEVTEVAKALLEILIYLHAQKPPVIHRDIKPSNILLSNRGNNIDQVYLVDFGSVQTLVGSEGGTMTVVGTYGYMPPEQFGGRTVPASDIYSLGATLIYLVTGIHPADLPQRDFRIQFEQAANLSPVVRDWLRWTIEPNLNARLNSAREALAALENLFQQPHPPEIPLFNEIRNSWYWNGNNWISKKQQRHIKILPSRLNRSAEYRHEKDLTPKFAKPTGSKIELTKNKHSLEILIPPTNFHPRLIFFVLFALISWNSFVLIWTLVSTIAFPVNILFALFSIPFWGAGYRIVSKVLFNCFRSTRLSLNQKHIALTWEIFGSKFNWIPPTAIQNITKLVYLPRTYITDSDGRKVEVPPQLIIWIGVKKYQLGGNKGIIHSDPEIEWLAHELSQWLGLSIHEGSGSVEDWQQ
ncbi:MAG: serine/threonine-protein kinase [Rhizonema sp. PD37]|nr:serine/threonine-protein kinase [Rhizonema sp. PD37]